MDAYTETMLTNDEMVVHADAMRRDSRSIWGKAEFVIQEMEFINACAYWDYQRDKIYVRSSRNLKPASKTRVKTSKRALPVNRTVQCLPPVCCPACQSTGFRKCAKASKIVYDVRFGESGVRRWVTNYLFGRYQCNQCKCSFTHRQPEYESKYGLLLLAYITYQIIELRLSFTSVAEHLNRIFGFDLNYAVIGRQKERASLLYQETYKNIRSRITQGSLVHADETRVSIDGKDAYIWVFSNLEEVVYVFSKTREGETAHAILKDFRGVLVSDFYSRYDAIDCPQQKCLIHLMRDFNEDLYSEPYNSELKELVREFAVLLKPMIETIDRFGLKSRFLRKHKVFVARFYKKLASKEYLTDIAKKNQKRLQKSRDTLFTFLDYDGIPWNNNNAEHAVKAFAWIRKVIGGNSSEKGIQDYLILLSICETCKFKGVDFFEFLRSGRKDIDDFIRKPSRVSNHRLSDQA